MLERVKRWGIRLKHEVVALFLAARDPRTPITARLLAGLVAAYALSPIDLIPDFVPVLGLLDDLVLVPAGIWLAIRLIPSNLLDELRDRATSVTVGRSRGAALVIIGGWTIGAVLLAAWSARLI